MFDWKLFVLLSAISMPGVVIVVPRLIASLTKKIQPTGKTLPPRSVMILAGIGQTAGLLFILAAVGTAVAPTIGFRAPFFEALLNGGDLWDSFRTQLFPSLIVGIGGALLFVTAYYKVFRPRLDEQSRTITENLRKELGLAGRIFYGGIFEEVLARWGLLSLIVWLLFKISATVTAVTIWISIVIAGLLFGLGHLPAAIGAGARATPALIATALILNLWASIPFGWLFWQYGLLAAMLGHIAFHLVWYPFEIHHLTYRFTKTHLL